MGCLVGSFVGRLVGARVGGFVGLFVGSFVGLSVGAFVGPSVGASVGDLVGCVLGVRVVLVAFAGDLSAGACVGDMEFLPNKSSSRSKILEGDGCELLSSSFTGSSVKPPSPSSVC